MNAQEQNAKLAQISLSILLSVLIFVILTIPHMTLFMFGFGFRYNMLAIMSCALLSGFISPVVAKSKYFKQQ